MKIVVDDNIKVRTCPHCFTQFIYDVSRDVSTARGIDGKKFLTVICPGCYKDIEEQYSISLKFILNQWGLTFYNGMVSCTYNSINNVTYSSFLCVG